MTVYSRNISASHAARLGITLEAYPQAANSEKTCGYRIISNPWDRAPAARAGHACTRPADHAGIHVAHAGDMICAWVNRRGTTDALE